MSRLMSALNRLVVAVVGALLLAAGLVPAAIFWNIPFVSPWVAAFDRTQLAAAPSHPWYIPALVAVTGLVAVLGFALIVANIRNRSFNNATVERAADGDGATVLNVQRIADAACAQLAASPMVDRAQAGVSVVGNRPTATFTVVSAPDAPLPDVVSLLETADEDLAIACPGVDLDTVYRLEYDRI